MVRCPSLLPWTVVLPLCLVVASGCDGCVGVKQTLVRVYPSQYEPSGDPQVLTPRFEDADAGRPQLRIGLRAVAKGLEQLTDIQPVPGQPEVLAVTEKGGGLKWVRLASGESGTLLSLPVLTASEQGLLGLAFHPQFEQNGRFFVNYVVQDAGKEVSRVAEWRVEPGTRLEQTRPEQERILLRVEQPYANHNAGQLAFGPDGMLYVGWGDGGWRDDPHKAGQDPSTLLGKMLRLDVEGAAGERAYRVPPDNPFVGREGFRPEIWALGLRNPWRFSFDPQGRLLVADVGQNSFEEISIVTRGGNYGWSLREGAHCFPADPPTCETTGLTDPIYEYGRAEGMSITGGYVYTGQKLPALQGQYVFGDFVSGRIWSLELPAVETASPGSPAAEATAGRVTSLGRWPILLSTFGRGLDGALYLADFGSGTLYALEPSAAPSPAQQD